MTEKIERLEMLVAVYKLQCMYMYNVHIALHQPMASTCVDFGL